MRLVKNRITADQARKFTCCQDNNKIDELLSGIYGHIRVMSYLGARQTIYTVDYSSHFINQVIKELRDSGFCVAQLTTRQEEITVSW